MKPENLPKDTNETQNDKTVAKDDKSSGIGYSLWELAMVLILDAVTGLEISGSKSQRLMLFGIVTTAILCWVNISIAKKLRADKVLTEKGTGLLNFNLFAVACTGVIFIIVNTIDALDLSDEGFYIIIGIIETFILPCYIVAQSWVAIRLMKDGYAVWLGRLIIASIVVSNILLGVLGILSDGSSFEGSTKTLYNISLFVSALIDLSVYFAYDDFFSSKFNNKKS